MAEKRIKEFAAKKELKLEAIGQLDEKLNERKKHLKAKKGELNEILKKLKKKKIFWPKKATEYQGKIESHLFGSLPKNQKNVKNGMAIVAIEREASGGSYFTIPPQIQIEIASRQKIITDEHGGRILVDQELAKKSATKWMLFLAQKNGLKEPNQSARITA